MNLDIITGFVTAPSTGAVAAAVTGDSLTIRGVNPGSRVLCLAAWSKNQAVGTTQLTRPFGHDTTRGLRWRNVVNVPYNKVFPGLPIVLQPQEPLTTTIVGSATAGDIDYASYLLWYENLPGVHSELLDVSQLRAQGVNLLTVEDTLTATATGYSGAKLINATSDLLRPNTRYAVLGATVGIVCHAVTMQGSDFGNLRIAVPGALDAEYTNDWFVKLNMRSGLPTIPVFNSGSRAGITLHVVQDENNTAVPVSWLLAELAPK